MVISGNGRLGISCGGGVAWLSGVLLAMYLIQNHTIQALSKFSQHLVSEVT